MAQQEQPLPDLFPAGMRVMVVDDDSLCLRVVEQMLRRCGYRVETQRGGRAALAALRARRQDYDLVLCDVFMPGALACALHEECVRMQCWWPLWGCCTALQRCAVAPHTARCCALQHKHNTRHNKHHPPTSQHRQTTTDMDGFKLLEAVGLELDLPVIMMSSSGDHAVVYRGVTHGACDFLVKPVRSEELRNIWQHVLRRRRAWVSR